MCSDVSNQSASIRIHYKDEESKFDLLGELDALTNHQLSRLRSSRDFKMVGPDEEIEYFTEFRGLDDY